MTEASPSNQYTFYPLTKTFTHPPTHQHTHTAINPIFSLVVLVLAGRAGGVQFTPASRGVQFTPLATVGGVQFTPFRASRAITRCVYTAPKGSTSTQFSVAVLHGLVWSTSGMRQC